MDNNKIQETLDRMIADNIPEDKIRGYFSRKGVDIDKFIEGVNTEDTSKEVPEIKNDDGTTNELASSVKVDDGGEKIEHNFNGYNAIRGAGVAPTIWQAVINKVGTEGAKELLYKAAYKAGEKLGWQGLLGKGVDATTAGLKWLKTTPGAIQLLVQGVTSLWEANSDRNRGLTKNDSMSMALDYLDNFAFDIPSGIYHANDKAAPWENETKAEQKAQVEDIKKNKQILKDYQKLGGHKLSNLMAPGGDSSRGEGGYLKEEKNIQKQFGANGVNEATAQLSLYAANNKLQNDADLKKKIIKDGYKFKTVTDNEGNSYQTWINDKGQTLLKNKKDIEQRGKVDYRNNSPEGETINI